jgi:hypothetical protein
VEALVLKAMTIVLTRHLAPRLPKNDGNNLSLHCRAGCPSLTRVSSQANPETPRREPAPLYEPVGSASRRDASIHPESFRSAKHHRRGYTGRQRKDAFDWISELAMNLMLEQPARTQGHADAAWRQALETCLEADSRPGYNNSGSLRSRNPKVLPSSHENRSHK